jgi:uncharacterized protein YhaN
MRLTYLWIQQFGKLKEREISLRDGINIIYGPNESGKSTLHSFIKGMLFGMPRYRGRASRTDPYTRYEPWERPVDYAGSMNFRAGGKEFHLERNFYKNDIRESLICETDGEELSVSQGDLQMLLGGISESIYDNTVSIGQLRSETDEGMVHELQKYMSNFEGTGSGELDIRRAEERLKKKKKEWIEKRQVSQERQSRQLSQAENRISYIRSEKEGLEVQLENIRREQIECEKELKKMMMEETQERERRQQEVREQETDRERKTDREQDWGNRETDGRDEKVQERDRKRQNRTGATGFGRIAVGCAFLGCIVLMLAAWNPFVIEGVWRAVWIAAGCALLLGGIVGLNRKTGVQSREPDSRSKDFRSSDSQGKNLRDSGSQGKDLRGLGSRGEGVRDSGSQSEDLLSTRSRGKNLRDSGSQDEDVRGAERLSRLRGKEEAVVQQLSEKSTLLLNQEENRDELMGISQEVQACDMEINSLELAMETLTKLSGVMRKKIGNRLQTRMEEILSEITEGRYSHISMDTDMRISLYESGRQIYLYQLSRGTVEQVYFALRMAVSEVLCEERMPVLLDDVFAMYDEKRLLQTLRWLAKWGGQVLIFTCHHREAELLERAGMKVNVIELEEM